MPHLTATLRSLCWRSRATALALLALVCAALLTLAALVPTAHAEDKALAHAQDGSATYTSVSDAWAAASSGTVVVMDGDWLMSSPLTLDEGKSAYIMMNGHKIYRSLSDSESKGCVVWLAKKANLTLDGTGAEATFTIKRYGDPDKDDVQVTSGGLVTGGLSSSSAGGVEMEEGAKLSLVNVAVSGNMGDTAHGGGVAMNGEGCSLTMTDAAIEYNKSAPGLTVSGMGGGVYINNEKTSVTMTRSSISYNWAEFGGGVYSDSGSTTITMNDYSKIDGNFSGLGKSYRPGYGGGVYFNKSYFKIVGDTTSSISKNGAAQYGGGVYICQKTSGTNEGSIKGVNFEENTALKGAGIYIDQEYVTVEDCTFTSNSTDYDGGAVHVNNDHTTIQGCTFTKNKAAGNGGAINNDKNYTLIKNCTITGNTTGKEGGGVFSGAYNDITLAGVVVIKGNTRTDGGNDDVFLNTLSGGGAVSYLQGTLEKGSKVGVRVPETEDRRIAKNFSDKGGSSLFIDFDGYYVSYGTDEGGDAWQRHATLEFQLTVDGTDQGKHKQGDTVSATATTGDAAKAFWRWSEASSAGLAPFADYVPDATSATLSFKMPQNDVSLVSEYVARTGQVTVWATAPRAGEALVEKATLQWTGADHTSKWADVSVSWSEVAADGSTKPAEGTAKAGATYVASATIGMDGSKGLAFALDMGASDVGVKFDEAGGASKPVGAASASVDAATETLSVTSNTYTLPKPKLASVEAAQVSVAEGATEAALRAALPSTATGKDADGNAVALTADAASADLSALLSGGHVAVPEGGEATVSLPVSSDAVDNPDGLMLEVTVTVDPTYLQVEFDAAGGEPAPEAQSVRWGTAASEPDAPALAGQTFLGWFAEGSQAAWDFKTPVTESLKLTAKWEPVVLSVTFDAAGGTPAPEAQQVAYGSCAKQPTAPTRTGYTFQGWYADGAKAAYDFKTPVTASLRLTAKWEPVVLSVTFDAAGGTPAPAAQSVSYGSCAKQPTAPTRTGYTFQGWYADGAKAAYDFKTPVTASLRLTAKWEPVMLSVTFDAAGGTPAPEAQQVAYGECAKQPTAPTRAGYTFQGWYADGAKAAYDFKTPVTASLKLTAKWEPAFTVTFDAANGDKTFTQKVVGGECALEPAEPARDGYEFLGWFTSAGKIYRFNELVNADLTLTAGWDLVPPTSFVDVPEGTWFHDWVAQASSLRLMKGYENDGAYTGYFGPDDAITRGQVATVLWRLAGCPQAQDGGCFPDVGAGQFYSKAVTWCVSQGIVTGYEGGANKGYFLPDANVSREELALMAWRFERWAGVKVADAPEAALARCTDAASVSSWAREACVWCAAAGIMTGNETAAGTLRLDPQQGTTRAQAAKMLVRAYHILWREVEPYAEGVDSEVQAQDASVQADEVPLAEAPTFDDVTFEGVQETGTEEAAPEGSQSVGESQPTDDQQAFEDTRAVEGAQPSSAPTEDASQPEFDAESAPEASQGAFSDAPAENADYAQVA